MTCTGSPLSWSGWNCGRALKSCLKNAFGDAFRRQKCFAEKMEAIWTNSFKIRGKSLYKNIRYARIKFKTFHTEFSIILSVVVVRWSRVEPMALVSDPVTYPLFFPSIFFFFFFVFFVFRFWLTPISIKVALGIVLWFLKAVARVMWWSFIVNPLCLQFLLCGKFCSLNTTINAHVIESTADISPLGVNMDEHLLFSKHISELRMKASQRVGVLSRLRKLIPSEAKLLLYKSSILPYLTYCHLMWHFCKASDARKVERVQERALRIVYNTHSVEYSNLLTVPIYLAYKIGVYKILLP